MATATKERVRRSRREVEQAMRVSEATQGAILASLDARVAVLDRRGVIVVANEAWRRFGKVRTAAGRPALRVGDNYLESLDGLARDGNEPAGRAAKAVRRVIAAGKRPVAIDYRLDTADGTHWVSCNVAPLEGSAGRVVVTHYDVTDRVDGHEALARAHGRLHALSQRMLSIQEEERRAISRELHDDLGQTLAALKIGLHRLAKKNGGDAALLQECLATSNEVIERLRVIARELRPPQLDQLGLVEALAWLAERQAAATGARIDCVCANGEGERAAPGAENASYRIAQEALNNATRHGRAKRIEIRVSRPRGGLRVSVRDDGSGFDIAEARARNSGHLGLLTMEERAELAGGRLEITSAPGRGTTVIVTFPKAKGTP